MAMNQLESELLKLLSLGKKNQEGIIRRIDAFIIDHGLMNLKKWRNLSNKKNSFLHELVERDLPDVIRHVTQRYDFDLNIRRDSDNVTLLQLAAECDNSKMCDFLKELGASEILTEDVSQWSPDDEKLRAMNIVWLDLEMTSIEEPEIMECAVIITDKDLKELARKEWVIHFEQAKLATLADWHQTTFADRDQGGNGLFADVLKSNLTKDQVEEELLDLLKSHCTEKKCPLGGSSIHIDKEVLKLQMPKVHNYLHYRIIDVSSFQGIMRRWQPWIETHIKQELSRKKQQTVNHRAMDDIEWSIAFMEGFRPMLPSPHNKSNNRRNEPASNVRRNDPQSHYRKGDPQSHYQKDDPQSHYRKDDPHSNVRKNDPSSNHRKNESPSNIRKNGPPSNERRRPSDSPPAIGWNPPPPRNNNAADNKPTLYADEKRLMERLMVEKSFDVKQLRLDSKNQQMYNANPHLREVFMNNQLPKISKSEFNIESRRLKLSSSGGHSDNNSPYEKTSTTEHWGQRKLLLVEIEFLTLYAATSNYLVVYAGAAPGSHINYLSRLFPHLHFDLIDTTDFVARQTKDVEIRSLKFTDDLARRYGATDREKLFICNVRTFNQHGTIDNDLKADMDDQMEWVKLMKPRASLLNFRLPSTASKMKYLEGDLVIEPWASKRGVECRLIVGRELTLIEYDRSKFENALYHFHSEKRVKYYEHDMDEFNPEGLDHCYDCRAEIFILQEYIRKTRKPQISYDIKVQTAQITYDMSREIADKKRETCLGFLRTLDVIPKK